MLVQGRVLTTHGCVEHLAVIRERAERSGVPTIDNREPRDG